MYHGGDMLQVHVQSEEILILAPAVTKNGELEASNEQFH